MPASRSAWNPCSEFRDRPSVVSTRPSVYGVALPGQTGRVSAVVNIQLFLLISRQCLLLLRGLLLCLLLLLCGLLLGLLVFPVLPGGAQRGTPGGALARVIADNFSNHGACGGAPHCAATTLLWWRGRLFDTSLWTSRAYLRVLVGAVVLPQVANQAGWCTAEFGRQPWVVYNLLRTSAGLSEVVSRQQVLFSLILIAAIYLLLLVLFIFLLDRKIRHGIEADSSAEKSAKRDMPGKETTR